MKPHNPSVSQVGESKHTTQIPPLPVPYFLKVNGEANDILSGSGRADGTALVATVNHGWGNGPETALFIITACNAYATLSAQNAKLEGALREILSTSRAGLNSGGNVYLALNLAKSKSEAALSSSQVGSSTLPIA